MLYNIYQPFIPQPLTDFGQDQNWEVKVKWKNYFANVFVLTLPHIFVH